MKPISLFKLSLFAILNIFFIIQPGDGSNIFPFSLNAQESSKFFPAIEGWKRSETIQQFTPENLYEYINGAAELYLSYDFQELWVAEYSNEKNASIVVEVYRQRTPLHAFGIYSQERPSHGNYLNIGAQGYLEALVLNFVTGNFYVKINSYDLPDKTEDVLQAFAAKLVANLGGNTSLPIALTYFPEAGKIPYSEKFIARNFLGQAFLHSGFTADYRLNESTFQLFIIQGADSNDCHGMLKQYLQLAKYSSKNLKEDRYIFSDPYHGKMTLGWQGRFIWGVFNLEDENLREKYLDLTAKLLQQ